MISKSDQDFNEANRSVRLHIVLDNVRSAFNVGSIFRTADATGCTKLYLCGITAQADNPKMYKTALGATSSVPSQYFGSTMDAIKQLQSENIPIYGVELSEKSEHFQQIHYPAQVALVFGNEITGINQPVLDMCEKLVFIPMAGIKESLNVAITASIMMYEALR